MRVISGLFRGKKLLSPISESTKPTLDRVKESMFSILSPYLVNSVCLDLFSGSGALGIECLSRGASQVILNDNNPLAIKIIKENLKGLDNYQLFNLDYEVLLDQLDLKFDLILIDPPFKQFDINQIVNEIIKSDILNENAVIMIESSKEEQFVPIEELTFKEYIYGKVKLTLLKVKPLL